MRILVIPEDFRLDQYLLRPLIRRLVRSLRAPNARVEVCQDPLLGGVGEALKADRIREVLDQYRGMIDVFVLCVDRDGQVGRRQTLDQLEAQFEDEAGFLAVNAWEEIETWALAGLDIPTDWTWDDVRAEVQVKEVYFDRLVAQRRLTNTPGRGREPLGEEASRRIPAIRLKCREDFDDFATRLASRLAG